MTMLMARGSQTTGSRVLTPVRVAVQRQGQVRPVFCFVSWYSPQMLVCPGRFAFAKSFKKGGSKGKGGGKGKGKAHGKFAPKQNWWQKESQGKW